MREKVGERTPDENTIRLYRNRLTESGALKSVMAAFDEHLHRKGCIPMSGQIIPSRGLHANRCRAADASLVPAPKQRNSEGEKEAVKAGKTARQIWPNKPNKAAQKDVDARLSAIACNRLPANGWTLKIGGKLRRRPDGTPLPEIALPIVGYKSHISIDRRFGFIRAGATTSASAVDGRMLRERASKANTASEIWADTAYRSKRDEAWLERNGFTSRIHRLKPTGRAMPKATARANAAKSTARARVGHVFAHQKNRYGLFIRTIGLARAEAKLTLANLVYNFDRLIFHERRSATP